MMVLRRLLLSLAGALLCAAASLIPVGAQQPTGTITGQVIDSLTRQPLAGVNVVVEGTGLGALTREDGTFFDRRRPRWNAHASCAPDRLPVSTGNRQRVRGIDGVGDVGA